MANDEEKEVKEEVKKDVKPTPANDKKEKKEKFYKELDKKNEKIAELEEKLASFQDKYYRAIADLDNQRKLHDKEYHSALKYGAQNLVEKLIPSFEMFSMVIEQTDNLPPEVSAYVQGFTMIHRQMVQALESEGVSEIAPRVGDAFDHQIHQAMETSIVEDEALDGTITKVVRKGYKIHERLIKPATVVVGKYNKEENKENNEEAPADAKA